eukprot:CAMPEP_0116830356 /NCGR_PEP_ID=MMETSP0418-20121206/4718_1 /TAXON_ID=1158023 /ORGANISM="Astrosyne radiata, Strain 13vi08-1A" /LENGTH=165 /DNA_ID=CAMNT_0004459451 /DNA_START=171 /DNA_END=668 /DNA_ORIENTATION=-
MKSQGYELDAAHQPNPDESESLRLALALAEEDMISNQERDHVQDDDFQQWFIEEEDSSADDDYETMLQLEECMGDVKQERWAIQSRHFIDMLSRFRLEGNASKLLDQEDDTGCKCLICQSPYEQNDEIRRLPCGHCFHVDCVDQWLAKKDACPCCRQSIVPSWYL